MLNSFDEAKALLNHCLDSFYANDSLLLDYRSESDAVAERCMVFHIGWYMIDKIRIMDGMEGFSVDSEYNRNYTHSKGMYKDTAYGIKEKIKDTYPDLLLHKRRSNEDNIIVVEFKKGEATGTGRDNDFEKLAYFTDQDKEYKYRYGFYVELYKHRVKVLVFQNGNRISHLDYSISLPKNKRELTKMG